MQFTWKPFITAIMVIALVSGCGTKETNEVKQPNPSNNDTTQTETAQSDNTGKSETSQPSSKNENSTSENGGATNTEKNKQQSNTEENKQQTNAEENKQQEARPSEMQLSYMVDGKEVKETASLKTSDNQGFSLYVLKGWELEAEEPHSDVLLHDDSFVRIRLLHEEGNKIDYAKLAEEHAQAVSSNAARQDSANLPESLKGAAWYTAQSENMTVHVIGTSSPVPMLVMIQTPKDKEELAPALAMMETIRKTDSAKQGEEAADPNESVSSSN
jgi:DNA mismatch repair ATPase MutL